MPPVIHLVIFQIAAALEFPELHLADLRKKLLYTTLGTSSRGSRHLIICWVDGFAFGVVRILIGFARIRSVCESVRIANQFAGEAVASPRLHIIKKHCESWSDSRESVQFANRCELRIDNPDSRCPLNIQPNSFS